MFLPGKNNNLIHVEASNYREKQNYIDGSHLGKCFHILLFKEDKNGIMCDIDLFEGIVGEPLEYISLLIPNGWFGMLCKKTTNSTKFVQKILDSIKNI
jgi:hypothetical protein